MLVLFGAKASLIPYRMHFLFPGLNELNKGVLVFSDFYRELFPPPAPSEPVAQAWKMTTETMAITANTIIMNVLDGVFISASGLTQRPRAYKHKIR